MSEAHDRQLRVDHVPPLPVEPFGEMVRQVVVLLDQSGEPVRPQVLPRHPELERTEPPGPFERELVPVQWLVLRLPDPVVLRFPMERVPQVLLSLHQQRADVVGLEEPFVRIDRHGVGPLQTCDATRVALRQPYRSAVRGVHVEPEPFPLGQVRKLVHRVDRAGVGRSGDGGDAERGDAPPHDPRRWRRRPPRRAGGTGRPTAAHGASTPGSPTCRRRARSRNAPDRKRRCARPRAAPHGAARPGRAISPGGRRAPPSGP